MTPEEVELHLIGEALKLVDPWAKWVKNEARKWIQKWGSKP